MFRAVTCPSLGGQIVFSQHLVSSLSVNGCTVQCLRVDCQSALNWCKICPPEDGHVNARNMSRIIM